MGHCCGTLLWDTLPAPQILHVLKLYYKVVSSQLPAPQIAPRTKVVLQSRQFSASSYTDCSAYQSCILASHQFSSSSLPDTPRTTNRTPACISRTRHARSPQRVARAWDKLHSRLRTRHARSPQRVARAWGTSHSRLQFAHSTCTSSAEGCASSLQYERFVRDFLKNSHVKVCKTSVSYETSSKNQAETSIGAHTSRSPAKQFRDSSPSKQHPLTRQSQCDSDIHLYHNSQPHDSLRLPRIFPRPHV